MIELAARRKHLAPPWSVCNIEPLDAPHFARDLRSLRLHLLTHSPPPFRRRNLFIDASIGDQISWLGHAD